MSGSILAVNITTDDIKLAEIGNDNGESVIRGVQQFMSGDDSGLNATEAIRKFIQEQKPRTLDALLVITSQDLDYIDFVFPFNSPKKVSKAIRFEVSSEYPVEEHIVAHIKSIAKEPGKNAFLAAIAKKEALTRRIKEIEDAGLHLVGITSDLSTLGNYFKNETEALVMEMGERQTLFALYAHGIPVLTRDVPIGMKQLLEGRSGSEGPDLRPLFGEIKRTIHSFNARTSLELKQVHASGNIFRHKEILAALRESLDLDFLDKLPEMPAFRFEKEHEDVNQYASLLGVAEWKKKNAAFNFFTDEFYRAQPRSIQRSYLRWGFIALSSLLLTIFLSLWLNLSFLDRRNELLSSEIRNTFVSAFPQTKRIVDELKQARNYLDARKSEFGQGDISGEVALLDVLETISRTIPAETSFEIRNLFWEKGKLEIDGKTDSFKTVNGIQEMLSGHEDFPEVTISNAKTTNDGQDVEFKITIRLAG